MDGSPPVYMSRSLRSAPGPAGPRQLGHDASTRLPAVHVAYVGPSEVAGYEHVNVAVIIGSLRNPSRNRKTGAMTQVAYLPIVPWHPHVNVVDAVIKRDLLPAACGRCDLQPTAARKRHF